MELEFPSEEEMYYAFTRPGCFWFSILFGSFLLFIAFTMVPMSIALHHDILIIRLGLTFLFPGLFLLIGGILCCRRHQRKINRAENPQIQQPTLTTAAYSPNPSRAGFHQNQNPNYDTLPGGITSGPASSTLPRTTYHTFPRNSDIPELPTATTARSHNASEGVYDDAEGVYENTKSLKKPKVKVDPIGFLQTNLQDETYESTPARFPTEAELNAHGRFPVGSIYVDDSITNAYKKDISDDERKC